MVAATEEMKEAVAAEAVRAAPPRTLIDEQRRVVVPGLKRTAALLVGPPDIILGRNVSVSALASEMGPNPGVIENVPPDIAETLRKSGPEATERGVRVR